ncbi:MAG TPA: hypothetical protein VFN09_16085 [Rhodanobacteraceae bacterium]|nr:hypothetical protein [Rhodanobacteraceae bacterium]
MHARAGWRRNTPRVGDVKRSCTIAVVAPLVAIRDELGLDPLPERAPAPQPNEPEAPFVDDSTAPLFTRRKDGASAGLFGGAEPDQPKPSRPQPAQTGLFAEPTTSERVRAAEESKDKARNGRAGGCEDTGDGGLFDGKRPEQAGIEESARFHRDGADGVRKEEGVEYRHGQETLQAGLVQWRAEAGFDDRAGPRIGPREWAEPSQYADTLRGTGSYTSERTSPEVVRAETERLIAAAKSKGFFLDDAAVSRTLGSAEPLQGGAEHDAYVAGESPNQIVIRNTVEGAVGAASGRSPAQYLQRLAEYNQVFPELQMRVIGVSERPNGDAVIWTAQHFVEGKEFKNNADLAKAMEASGWDKVRGSYSHYVNKETGAVIADAHTGKMRNGDWVAPVRAYAREHADRIDGRTRIIAQEVPIKHLYFDGNSSAELDYDDGRGYAYRNTKNNRKLLDAVTRDENGNVIPLSKRFNVHRDDPRFSRSDAERRAAQKRRELRTDLTDPRDGGAIGWNFDESKWEGAKGTRSRTRSELQDKMLAWRDVQDNIEAAIGETIPDAENVYRLENLMHGRVKERTDELEHDHVVPLVKAIKASGVGMDAFEQYLYARHAKERNAEIAKLYESDPQSRLFDGVTSKQVEDGFGSGMTNAEADAILAGAEKLVFEPLAARLQCSGFRGALVVAALEMASWFADGIQAAWGNHA